MLWEPREHSDAENLQWCGLRAIEWGSWPAYLSQPITPIAIVFIPWFFVILFVLGLNIVWGVTLRYRFVSPTAAAWGPLFALLRWVTCPGAAIYLWLHGRRIDAVVALLWPLVAGTVLSLPPTRIGKLQRIFMSKLGYTEEEVEAVWANAGDLVSRVVAGLESEKK